MGKILDTRGKKYYIAVTGLDVLTIIMTFETIKYIDRVCCKSGYFRNTKHNTQTQYTQMTGGRMQL
jgi:hypothetical protein